MRYMSGLPRMPIGGRYISRMCVWLAIFLALVASRGHSANLAHWQLRHRWDGIAGITLEPRSPMLTFALQPMPWLPVECATRDTPT